MFFTFHPTRGHEWNDNESYVRLLAVLRLREVLRELALQNNYEKCTDRSEKQGTDPPPQATPAFRLGKTGIDERESKPANGKFFTLHSLDPAGKSPDRRQPFSNTFQTVPCSSESLWTWTDKPAEVYHRETTV